MHKTKFESNLEDELISEYIKLLDDSSDFLLISRDDSLFDKFKLSEKNFQPCIFNDNVSDLESQSEILNISENNFNSLQTKKFHTIILLDVLEYSQNPSVFLSNMKNFLDADGKIILNVYNVTNLLNKIKFLDNDFNSLLINFEKKLSLYTLDELLLLFSDCDFSIKRLIRIKKEISLTNQNEIKNFVVPPELFESLLYDHEYDTFFYIFEITPNSTIQPFVRKWVTSFSKNIVSERLQFLLEELKNSYKKKIEYHIQTNREQYALIKHLEQAISEKDEYITKIIKIIKDKDAYTEQIIKDKDAQLDEIKQSAAFKILRSIDKLRGKSENN